MSDPLVISRTDISSTFNTSDHNTFSIDILYWNQSSTTAKPHIKQLLWIVGNYNGMRTYLLQYNRDNLFTYSLTVDSLWHAFFQVLDDTIEQFVPYNGGQQLPKKNIPSDTKCRNWSYKQRCLWCLYKCHPKSLNYAVFHKKAAMECKTAVQNFQIQQEKQVTDAVCSGHLQSILTGNWGIQIKLYTKTDNWSQHYKWCQKSQPAEFIFYLSKCYRW